MQQEIIRKKREIIDLFLKNGILLSSRLLEAIENHEQAEKIFEILKSKKSSEEAVAEIDLDNLLKEEFQKEKSEEKNPLNKVKIIYSYNDEPKKRELQDFVEYFNNRYKALERILKQRQELKNTISINRISI